jgi:hypothetical protein
MSEEFSNPDTTTTIYAGGRAASRWSKWSTLIAQADRRKLSLAVFVVGMVLMFAYHPFKQSATGDAAIYDYMAQSILRGELPYRDVIDPKTPASMYLSAAAMAAGKLIGVRDVLAVRGLHILLMGLLVMVIYLVAEAYLDNRPAAILACLIPLMREDLVLMMLQGTQPKLPMMLFGMMSLLLIARDRPFWAGFCAMLSCLCWQPGLLFAGTAFLIFSRYLTSWRDLRALKVVAGAVVPLLMTILYFHLRGALGPLYEWTLVYPYTVVAPYKQRTLLMAVEHLWRVTNRVFQMDVLMLALSALGFARFLFERLRVRLKRREWLNSEDCFKEAILFPPVVYLAFCLVNMQGGPDLIPFLPFIGIFGGWFFAEVARRIAGLGRSEASAGRLSLRVQGLALATILLLVVGRAVTHRFEGWSLQEQDEILKKFTTQLEPGDKLYVHGSAEILLLLNRQNLNPYIAFDSGADDYVAAKKPGGFREVIEEMESQAPRFVVMARIRHVAHRQELEQWVAAHYEKLPVDGYEIYIRKQD